MELAVFHKGFNYSQDGAGNRLVYHLQRCNLNCPWCANPEGMEKNGPDTFFMSTEELIDEVIRSKPMFFDGGGVTFTGGEATCQFTALKEVLQHLHGMGISTAMETNGTSPRLSELFPLLDELIMDFKHYHSDIHERITGLNNGMICKNLRVAMKMHPNLLIRIPLIGGFNASLEDMKEFIAFFTSQDTTRVRFELLTYHEYGKDKWLKCGKEYTVTDAFVSEETRQLYEIMMREQGLCVVRT